MKFFIALVYFVPLVLGRPQSIQTGRLHQQHQNSVPLFPMQQQNSVPFYPQQVQQNSFKPFFPTRRPPYVPIRPIYPIVDNYANMPIDEFCSERITGNVTIKTSPKAIPAAGSGDESSEKEETLEEPALRMIMVVDETGSMRSYTDVTIESFNGWLNSQRGADLEEEDVPPQFSFVKFDTGFSVKSWENIEDAEEIDRDSYQPGGGTALYDALGCVLSAYGEEEDNIVVIITDGEDNSSKKFNTGEVKKLIDGLTEEKGWEFSYIGANQDPLAVSGSLGISTANTQSYDFSNDGFRDMYSKLTSQVHASRQNQYQKRVNKGR